MGKKITSLTLIAILLLGIFIFIVEVPTAKATDTLYENYNTGDDDYWNFKDTTWAAQTFTVGSVAHTVTGVKIKIDSGSEIGDFTLSIRATDLNGHPTGNDLTSHTIDGSITSQADYTFFLFDLPPYNLNANTKYAIVCRAPNSASQWVYWRSDSSSPTYSGGNREWSLDSGSSWTTYTTQDFMFEVYGTPINTAPTYSSISASSTTVGTSSIFSSYWDEDSGLSGYIFSTNNTGSWQNDTWTAFASTPSWANVTKTLNSTVRQKVGYQWYVNDTSNLWNSTGIQTLELTPQPPTDPTVTVTSGNTANVSRSPFAVRYQNKMFYAAGLYWLFYTNGTSTSGQAWYTTSPDGATWSAPTYYNSTRYYYGESLEAWFDGQYVTTFVKGNPLSEIYYQRGLPQSDGTIDWDTPNQQIAYSAIPSGGGVEDHYGILDSEGYPVIGQWSAPDGGTTGYNITISNLNNGTWSTASGYPVRFGEQTNKGNGIIVPLSNRCLYVIRATSGSAPEGLFYDGSTWGNVEPICDENTFNEYPLGSETWSISAVKDSEDNIHLVFLSDNLDIVYLQRINSTRTWTSSSIVQANVTTQASPTLSIDNTSDTIVCFWQSSPTENHIFLKVNIGGAWNPTPIDWIDETTSTLPITTSGGNSTLNAAYYSMNGNFGVAYTTGSSAPYTIKVALIPVSTLNPAVNPDVTSESYSITIAPSTITPIQGDTVIFTVTVTKDGSDYSDFIVNATKDAEPLEVARTNCTSFIDTESNPQSHTYHITGLYDTGTSEQIEDFTYTALTVNWQIKSSGLGQSSTKTPQPTESESPAPSDFIDISPLPSSSPDPEPTSYALEFEVGTAIIIVIIIVILSVIVVENHSSRTPGMHRASLEGFPKIPRGGDLEFFSLKLYKRFARQELRM